jgi:uncharacterized YkwD family protein
LYNQHPNKNISRGDRLKRKILVSIVLVSLLVTLGASHIVMGADYYTLGGKLVGSNAATYYTIKGVKVQPSAIWSNGTGSKITGKATYATNIIRYDGGKMYYQPYKWTSFCFPFGSGNQDEQKPPVEQPKPEEKPPVEQPKPEEKPPVEQPKPEEKPPVEQPKPEEKPPVEQPKPGGSYQLSADEQKLIQLVNQERTKAGLKPLAIDYELARVARIKSQDMESNNYFSHDSPTYGSPFQMMKNFGIKYTAAGENIAKTSSVDRAHTGLMNSEGHRANILNPNFTHIGVGISGYYYTQMFIRK